MFQIWTHWFPWSELALVGNIDVYETLIKAKDIYENSGTLMKQDPNADLNSHNLTILKGPDNTSLSIISFITYDDNTILTITIILF